MIMKQSKEKFDFKAFGQAIKAARKAKGISRNQLADTLNIAPRYIHTTNNQEGDGSLETLRVENCKEFKNWLIMSQIHVDTGLA